MAQLLTKKNTSTWLYSNSLSTLDVFSFVLDSSAVIVVPVGDTVKLVVIINVIAIIIVIVVVVAFVVVAVVVFVTAEVAVVIVVVVDE